MYAAARIAIVVLVGGLVALAPSAALADRAFGPPPRFTVNTQGDITIAANSLLSCLDSLAACENVRDGVGGNLNNNQRVLTWIDKDKDPATTNSSSADLVIPPGGRCSGPGCTSAARCRQAPVGWGGRRT